MTLVDVKLKNAIFGVEKQAIKLTVTCDNFVASLMQLVSSRPRDSSETFLLGKLVGHHAQSPVR